MNVKFRELAKSKKKQRSTKGKLPTKSIKPLESLGKTASRKTQPKKFLRPLDKLYFSTQSQCTWGSPSEEDG